MTGQEEEKKEQTEESQPQESQDKPSPSNKAKTPRDMVMDGVVYAWNNLAIVSFILGACIISYSYGAKESYLATSDTPTLVNALMTFCGSKGAIYSVCTTDTGGSSAIMGNEQLFVTIQRKQACSAILEELGQRGVSAEVMHGDEKLTVNFNETTLDDLLELG